MKIVKRNGNLVDFNKDKIINAINKAFIEVDGRLYETDTAFGIAEEIEQHYKENLNVEEIQDMVENGLMSTKRKDVAKAYVLKREERSVEEIQDMVEDYLMRSERKDVAKAYIRYRYKKEISRKHKKDWNDALSNTIMAKDVKNQNANVDEYSFGGRVGETADLVMRKFALIVFQKWLEKITKKIEFISMI